MRVTLLLLFFYCFRLVHLGREKYRKNAGEAAVVVVVVACDASEVILLW
jgi:hypothetical protein